MCSSFVGLVTLSMISLVLLGVFIVVASVVQCSFRRDLKLFKFF